jgi:Protein of unknown function (DUF1552)
MGQDDQSCVARRDPRAAYKRIFEGFTPPGGGTPDAGPPPQSQLNRGRVSVLDHAAGRLNKLRQTVGAADRAKIDAHLAAVASLQQGFSVPTTPPPPPPTGGGCAPKEPVLSINVPTGDCGVNDNAAKACELDKYYADLGKAHMDVLVQALACDVTRVTSLQWGAAGRGSYFSVAGAEALPGGGENEHLISHLGTSDGKMEAMNGIYVLLKRWYTKQLVYLIERLKAIPEGTGTLFDNTLILVCSEHGVGASHSPDNIPFVLVGGNWYFKTGRYLTYQNISKQTSASLRLSRDGAYANDDVRQREILHGAAYGTDVVDRRPTLGVAAIASDRRGETCRAFTLYWPGVDATIVFNHRARLRRVARRVYAAAPPSRRGRHHVQRRSREAPLRSARGTAARGA